MNRNIWSFEFQGSLDYDTRNNPQSIITNKQAYEIHMENSQMKHERLRERERRVMNPFYRLKTLMRINVRTYFTIER